jgi:hypothetical protein
MQKCLIFFLLFCAPLTEGDQVSVDFQILPNNGQNVTIDDKTLSNYNQQSGSVIQFSSFSQTVETQLSALQCPTGTYSSITPSGGQTCQKCPAGTASPLLGASNVASCAPCSTGSFSLEQASVCTDCTVNTFSVTPSAPSVSYCMKCPTNTTSPTHSSAVEMCVCNPGFFLSDNVMLAIPYDSVPISMPLTGIVNTNVPHVSC